MAQNFHLSPGELVIQASDPVSVLCTVRPQQMWKKARDTRRPGPGLLTCKFCKDLLPVPDQPRLRFSREPTLESICYNVTGPVLE